MNTIKKTIEVENKGKQTFVELSEVNAHTHTHTNTIISVS